MRQSLGNTLLFYILLCSSLVTLCTTAIQLYLEYDKDINELEKVCVQVEKSFMETLSQSVWKFDHVQIDSALKGIKALPGVNFAEITSPNFT